MKKLLLLAMSVAALTLNAQVYTNYFEGAVAGENLVDYMAHDEVDQINNLWAKCEKAGYAEGESPVFSSEDNLKYGGYVGSEKGISVRIDSSNEDDAGTRLYTRGFQINGDDTLNINFGSGVDTTVYVAFLIKPLAYDFGSMRDIISLEKSSTGNWSRARAFMDIIDGTGVQFGVGKKDSPTGEGDTTMTYANGIGSTYLVVLKYQQFAGGPDPGNDVVSLCVNPDLSLSEAEQTYIFADSTEKDYDSDGVLKVNICQRGHTADIGCMRVGTDWSEVLLGTAATGVSVAPATLDLEVADFQEIVATLLPEGDAAPTTITWSSSDETVATVDEFGVVTAEAPGTATITASINDGAATAECVVTVAGETGIFNASTSIVTIYPNPSSGAFTIANSEGADVVVYNVTGKAVYQKSNIENNEFINANLSKGLYFVSVTKENDQAFAKLIIE